MRNVPSNQNRRVVALGNAPMATPHAVAPRGRAANSAAHDLAISARGFVHAMQVYELARRATAVAPREIHKHGQLFVSTKRFQPPLSSYGTSNAWRHAERNACRAMLVARMERAFSRERPCGKASAVI